MGLARGRDAEWRSVGHGGLTDRIEHGDSTAYSVPIPGRKSHCLLSGVALFPVVGNGVGRPDQPLFVASKLLQDSRLEELCAIPGAMAERFQQACRSAKICG